MLERQLEPEVMDTPEEAQDYNAMDHRAVNETFVDDFVRLVERSGVGDDLSILDVGTGTALIPIEACTRVLNCTIRAVDLAESMLAVARTNVQQAGFEDAIQLEKIDAKAMPYEASTFDAVISNSIVHHIPEPLDVIREMDRVLRPGGLLLIRDLLRPDTQDELDGLVQTYAGDENDHAQQMFRDSLHAALSMSELRELISQVGWPVEWAEQTSDRHWTVCGQQSSGSSNPN